MTGRWRANQLPPEMAHIILLGLPPDPSPHHRHTRRAEQTPGSIA